MKHTCKNKLFITKKQAFTLIELLIVIAIIGILFIVLVSKVDFATDKAKATGVQTDFRSFQLAFDTVAKENTGFNTFGWDTGDANQNGKRDSYDEGDNGAGGGIAQNGIQDGTEVFTGHKVYAETFTKIFSLKKNGTGSYDRDALNRLETAINANLDPKLHITIKDDGEIVMANGAQDPWNKEYHGWYITNAEVDKKDRGAIIMYSDGANNEFGSEHKIENGVVSITVPGNNKNGKDDYSIASVYTYLNGYGEVKNITTGFSNNQIIHGDNLGVNVPENPTNPDDPETPDVPDIPDEPAETILYSQAGLYKTGTTELLYTWEELLSMNVVTSDFTAAKESDGKTSTTYAIEVLSGDLCFPETTNIPASAFKDCTNLNGVIFTSSSRISLGQYAFPSLEMLRTSSSIGYGNAFWNTYVENIYYDSVDSLLNSRGSMATAFRPVTPVHSTTSIFINDVLVEHLVVPEGYSSIEFGQFCYYTKLKSVELPSSVTEIHTGAFANCTSLETINLDYVQRVDSEAFYGAKSLTSISLNNVETIYGDAFEDCSNLTSVYIGKNLKSLGDAFIGNSTSLQIFCDKDLSGWMNAWSPSSQGYYLTSNPYRLFLQGAELSGELIIPDEFTSIKDGAFSGVAGIKSVHLKSNMTIGKYAFYNSGLESVLFDNGFSTISDYAFQKTNLVEINIPDSIVSIGKGAFSSCKKLTAININETSQLKELKDNIFEWCSSLSYLFIPKGIVRLETPGLIANSGVKNIEIAPDTKLEYLSISLASLSDGTYFAIPDSVKEIASFDIHYDDVTLVFGENSQLEKIGSKCFNRYGGNLYIPKNVKYIDENAFQTGSTASVTIHPENTYFKVVDNCLIDIANKRLVVSDYNNGYAILPTDGSVTSLGNSSAVCVRYLPKSIIYINAGAFYDPHDFDFAITYEGTIEELRVVLPNLRINGITKFICADGEVTSGGTITYY